MSVVDILEKYITFNVSYYTTGHVYAFVGRKYCQCRYDINDPVDEKYIQFLSNYTGAHSIWKLSAIYNDLKSCDWKFAGKGISGTYKLQQNVIDALNEAHLAIESAKLILSAADIAASATSKRDN